MSALDYRVLIAWRPVDPSHLRRWYWAVDGGNLDIGRCVEGWAWTPEGAQRKAEAVVRRDAASQARIHFDVRRGYS